jgi:hypothetical protein
MTSNDRGWIPPGGWAVARTAGSFGGLGQCCAGGRSRGFRHEGVFDTRTRKHVGHFLEGRMMASEGNDLGGLAEGLAAAELAALEAARTSRRK